MSLLSSIARKKASDEISSTGLRIVILQLSEVEEHYSNSTIVVKSGLKYLTQTNPIITTSLSNSNSSINSYYSSVINSSAAKNITTTSISSCFNGGFNSFLKSCHLCKKPLCPDKDVYMYRGDQGFCSIECRSKQIMVDEMKEMDAKTKSRLRASSIDCQGCETCKLLEDLRQRRIRRNNKFKPLITPPKHHPLLSFS